MEQEEKMNETFFISDTHFGHKNILVYEKEHRHFSCIEEHDEELIKRWNNTVSKKDKVWHLGDFCFGRKNIEIAGRLNGDKRLIMGNHDVYPVTEYAKFFSKIYGVFGYKTFILSHVPLHPSSRWEINIHGHLHSNNVMLGDTDIKHDGYFNVSCEQINLTPINFDVIKEKY